MEIPEKYFCDRSRLRSVGVTGEREIIGCGFVTAKSSRRVRTDEYSLLYIIRGHGHYLDADMKAHEVKTGNVFQRMIGMLHQTVPHETWFEIFLHVPKSLYTSLVKTGLINPKLPLFDAGIHLGFIEDAYQFLTHLETWPESRSHDLIVEMHRLLVNIFDLARRRDDHENDWRLIDEFSTAINQDPGDRCSIEEMITPLGVGYERFRKVFRQHLGVSPNTYRIRQRVDKARAFLQEGRSIKEIAGDLGYSNVHIFSRQFHEVTGEYPGAYQKIVRASLP